MFKSSSAPCLLSLAKGPASCRSGPVTSGRQGGGCPTKAHTTSAPPPPASLLDQFLQSAEEGLGRARGLAATECFELYGLGQDAPPLSSLKERELTPEESWAVEQESRLAACLSMPTTGQERNAGELLSQQVRRLGFQSEVDTQLRFLRELNREVVVSPRDEVEMLYAQGRTRRLRKRRGHMRDPKLDVFGLEDESATRQHSAARLTPDEEPAAKLYATLYASVDGTASTMTVDEDEQPLELPTVDGSIFEEMPSEAEETDMDEETASTQLTETIQRLQAQKQHSAPAAISNVLAFPKGRLKLSAKVEELQREPNGG